jgi:hypothetical protein
MGVISCSCKTVSRLILSTVFKMHFASKMGVNLLWKLRVAQPVCPEIWFKVLSLLSVLLTEQIARKYDIFHFLSFK